jgi:hypothetical protein
MSQSKFVNGFYNENTNMICNIFPMAKFNRLSFENSSIQSANPFKLLHIDMWGKFPISTSNGLHYFLIIVDDYSRIT